MPPSPSGRSERGSRRPRGSASPRRRARSSTSRTPTWTSALYFISVEQGIDPRDYVLVASGGAGPMQAVAIAAALGVRKVLIPPTPGLNSAVGLLATDLKHEIVRTNMKPARATAPEALRAIFAEMEAGTRALLEEEGVADADVRISREIAMCYVGQSYQLKLPVPEPIDGDTWRIMTDAFHRRHAEAYGFANEREPTQFVNLRLIGIGRVERPRLRVLEAGTGSPARALKAKRPAHFQEAGGMVDCAIYDRDALLAGDRFEGPAIVEQMDTTTVVPPGAQVTVDRHGSLLIEI
jgi:N-methylhydantoinase A